MPITAHELVDQFGGAAERGNAVLFVGAGLSMSAGLPSWLDLIDEPRLRAGVPLLEDAPLMAQYVEDSPKVGRDDLESHVLQEISKVHPMKFHRVHRLAARLGVREIWTSNYDQFLETACEDAVTVWREEDVHSVGSKSKTVIKMHGSARWGTPPGWDSPPVLTRGDYERYEDTHRRLWTMLQATYLTRTLLFVGFSFSDPNVELLQRLGRRYGTAAADKHLAVMRPPSKPEEHIRYVLQRDDLERTGIRICEIDEYKDLEALLESLSVRTRPRRLFLSGSGVDTDQLFTDACELIAEELGIACDWELASLGGPAAWSISKRVGTMRLERGEYDASRIVFHFRRKDAPSPPMDARIGSAVHSSLDREQLVDGVLSECRALLAVGGGVRTKEEMRWAHAQGVGVVPLPIAGGSAKAYWEGLRSTPPRLGMRDVRAGDWEDLGDRDPVTACQAAFKLLRQAMYG